jgi:hypothetical protein
MAQKPYTAENDIICWHYEHSQDRSVKGINFVTCLYHAQGYSLPVGFSIVAKTEHYVDKKDGKQKRRSPISKNEYYRELLTNAKHNQIPFKYVLSDVCTVRLITCCLSSTIWTKTLLCPSKPTVRAP